MYTGIRLADLKRALNFYRKVMNMKIILRGKKKHGGIFVHLRSPKSQQRLELNWYPTDNEYYTKYRHGEELDHLAFWCENARDEIYSLLKKGAVPAIEPFKEERYELAFVKELDRIWIELLGSAKPARKK